MSIEESLAKCVVGTGLAGVACIGAFGTGGLGAAACGLSVGSAAIDCYGAGKDTWEWYEKNYPQEAKEIIEREREEREREEREALDPSSIIDPHAADDDAWNSVYQAGIDHLSAYSSAVEIYAKIGDSLISVPRSLRFATTKVKNRAGERSKEQARDALVGVQQSWLAWLDDVEKARFTTIDQAAKLTAMIGSVKKFTAMRHYLKGMKFPS